MKISVLTPDLSHNCLGRAYLLAKILQRRYEVEIVGPLFGKAIWKPLADDRSVNYKSVKLYGKIQTYWQIKKLVDEINGDVIYASKPLLTSFGIGLLKKLLLKKPLILDIDDWEMGLIEENYKNLSLGRRLKSLINSLLYFYGLDSYWNRLSYEKLVKFADEVTVASRFLKKKFGGTIVWHGRDTKAFDPQKFKTDVVRKKHGVESKKNVIIFCGSPGPYKGLEVAIQALKLIEDQDIIFVIVGIGDDDYSQGLLSEGKKTLGERFQAFGLQPFKVLPEFLAMADLVIIPQRKTLATVGQMPAKVFDAMAMAKPIIATTVSDLPEVLVGCGFLVQPEKPGELARIIRYALNNPKEAKELGRRAREKCIRQYSWKMIEKVLVGIFQKYEKQ